VGTVGSDVPDVRVRVLTTRGGRFRDRFRMDFTRRDETYQTTARGDAVPRDTHKTLLKLRGRHFGADAARAVFIVVYALRHYIAIEREKTDTGES